jgi:hypothetical protein
MIMLRISILLLALLFLALIGCEFSVDYEKKNILISTLTDELAIKYTAAALAENGFDLETMTPVAFSNDSKVMFARNRINPNEGFVLWHYSGRPTKYEYMVFIGLKDGKIRCRIKAAK